MAVSIFHGNRLQMDILIIHSAGGIACLHGYNDLRGVAMRWKPIPIKLELK